MKSLDNKQETEFRKGSRDVKGSARASTARPTRPKDQRGDLLQNGMIFLGVRAVL